MSSVTLHEDKNIVTAIAGEIGDLIRPKIIPPMLQDVVLSRRINSVKIVRIRRQLENGTYELDERLDAVLDNILDDIKD